VNHTLRILAAAVFTASVARAAPSPAASAAPSPAASAAPASALGAKRAADPDASLAGRLGAPAGGAKERAAPALEFEKFRYAVEGQVSGKRREEIRDLEQLLRLGGDDAEVPGWLFRLAELHWEESQYLFFEANRRDDAIARGGDPGAAARARAEKAALERRSREEQDRAIERYRTIATRFPEWERLDEVLFFLGENLWKQGRRPDALASYKALVTRFPRSRFVPDAWMAFGEHFFDLAEKADREANLRKALTAYERAGAAPASAIAGFARYKQAWVHYNLGDWERALSLFEQVIRTGDRRGAAATADKALALAREARKDYVRSYLPVGSPRGAAARFAQVGGPEHARAMTKGLADLYWESGKDREAILVYHGLIEADPAAADAPLLQARIVTAAGRIGRKDLAVAQARRLGELLAKAGAAGAPASEEEAHALDGARRDAENTLRTLAVQYHAEWRKTADAQTARHAEALYREYLALFPEERNARELRFYHAELLFALERFQEAGDEYTRVAEAGAAAPAGPGGKPLRFQLEALESAVLAYAEVEKRGGARPAPGAGKPAMTPVQKQLVDACERYLAFAPSGPKAVEIAYQAAQSYYAHEQLPQAERLFTSIATGHPRHELARFSANLALDTLNLRSDWRGMNALARRFWEEAELVRAHPELREDLARVVEQSSFKLVEELQRDGRHAEAAEAYLAFATDWPRSKLAPTAIHNAGVALAQASALDRAVAVRAELAQRYPDHPLAAKALAANAQDWAATADFERAADAWERYFAGWRKAAAEKARPAAARKSPAAKAARAPAPAKDAPAEVTGPGYEEAVARDGLFDAAVIRQALGQPRKAEGDRLAFLEAWPRSKEAPQVFLSLADLAAQEGQHAKEARLLREYQGKYARTADEWLVAQHRIARSLERRGDVAGARRAWAEALAHARGRDVGERGMAAVAQARYLALEPDFEAYEKIGFDVPPQRLKARLAEKAGKLEALQRRYTEVVNLKSPEPAVCALWRIGVAYRRFGAALLAAPVPRELRGQRQLVAEYRAQLAAIAEAPEKKGIEGLELAVAKARELGVENACAREAERALAAARPGDHGPVVERLPPDDPEPAVADPEGAWREARAALARDPTDRAAFAPLARAALARGKPGLARLVAARAEKVAPGDPDVAFLRGRALAAEGDRAGARAEWLAAAGKGHAGARRELLAAALAARDWKGVAEHARELEEVAPQDARAPLARGIAERHLGHADEALAAYDRAEQLGGGQLAEVHLARSVVLARLKRECEAATAELRRYERLAGPAGLDPATASQLARDCAAPPSPPVRAVPAAGDTRVDARPAGAPSVVSSVPSR
jgi:TolA-binding protein